MVKNEISEAQARLEINKMLEEAGWILTGDKANVLVETSTKVKAGDTDSNGMLDYLLLDSKGHPLCVLEAKKPSINPLSAKEQARRYAASQNIRLVILSNGETSYVWDIEMGNPQQIFKMPTQEALEGRANFKTDKHAMNSEKIIPEYVALTQNAKILEEPDYKNPNTKNTYLFNNGYRVMRDYQVKAVQAVQNAAANGQDRFLIEMATGLGKTLTAAAIMKMFLRTGNAHRILFLVDRIELERQAFKDLNKYLSNDYIVKIYKQNKKDWRSSSILISTIQSLMVGDRYRDFAPTDFDFIISDEAHRSLGGDSRAVFEYFTGYKLGLTATPKDYLKNVDIEKLNNQDPKALERRILLSTYETFGCKSGDPTYRYSLVDGVNGGYLIAPKVLDIKTGITTQLLSEQGYKAVGMNDEGEEAEAVVFAKDFEKTYFNDNTNMAMCQCFMENAAVDPISGEIGKTLIFARSRKHAAKLTQILNELGMAKYPGKYNSDFAMQITSDVQNAQDYTTYFSENNLSGTTRFLEGYKSCKTRVCITVGMMTTGYDCPDLLNVVFMRPVFSPTEFVQMKGRGTRKHTFKYVDIDKNETSIDKEKFVLFDFFENCKFFDNKFDYDAELDLPQGPALVKNPLPPTTVKQAASTQDETPDKVVSTETGNPINKVDTEMWSSIVKDNDLSNAVDEENWDLAINLFKERHENKPSEFWTIEKFKSIFKLDRRPTRREILERLFKEIEIPKKAEKIKAEEDKIILAFGVQPELQRIVRSFVSLYIGDNIFREIIQKKEFPRLETDYTGIFSVADYKALGDLKNALPEYILDNINLNDYMG